MKKILVFTFFIFISAVNAQIKVANSSTITPIGNSSAFIDASSSSYSNSTTNLGKGLAFPRVNLATFVGFGIAFSGGNNNFPTRYDGMLVYNTATGLSGIGSVAVKPGFYYYRNTSTTNNNSGTWLPVGSGNVLLSGNVPPVVSIGADGDFYIDTTVFKLYGPKVTGAWPSTGALIGGADYTGSTPISITNRVVSLEDNGVSLTSKVNGVLPVANGGTGASNLSGYIKGNGTDAFSTLSSIPVTDVSEAVRKVNGNLPDVNGNVVISFGEVKTGLYNNKPPTDDISLKNGDIYVVSGDVDVTDSTTGIVTSNNGRTFIFDYSVKTWNEVTSNQAATDARYVKLSGSTMAGDLVFPTGKKVVTIDAPKGSTDVANKAYVDKTVSEGTPDANTATKGKIQLGGDLAGTNSSAETPVITDNAITTNKIIDGAVTDAKIAFGIDKTKVGLEYVNNTSDENKPISILTESALSLKSNIASPDFTGTPTAPTALVATNTTQIATTEFVTTAVTSAVASASIADATALSKGKIQLGGDLAGTNSSAETPVITDSAITTNKIIDGAVTDAKIAFGIDKTKVGLENVNNTSDENKPISILTESALSLKSNIESPDFTGTPTAPTALVTTNTTQIATTEFVTTAVASVSIADATALSKGKIQLGGDLAGTDSSAANPVITNSAVNFAKIQNVQSDKVLGRISPNEGVVEEISTTGSGNIVRENSPVLTSPTLGVATATSINGLIPTATTSGFTIAGGAKTLTVSDDTTVSGTNTGDQTTIIGNAGTATQLAASKNINGVAFDGSADITVAAAAGTLTGTTLAATVVNSSLTSVGTLSNLTVTNAIVGSVTGNAATVTTNANLTGDVTSIGNETTIADSKVTNSMLAGSIDLTTKVINKLPVANGGTGAASLSGYLKGNGTAAFSTLTSIPVADVTGAVKTVNGTSPGTDGNVAISFGEVKTGLYSNKPPADDITLKNGDIYVVSGDTDITDVDTGIVTSNNGRTFIFDATNKSWNEVTSNQASTDLRYVKLSGATMAGKLIFPKGTAIITDDPEATTDAVNKAYVDRTVSEGTPDADLTTKGKIQLGGDLAGTDSSAANPVITNSAVSFAKIQNVQSDKVLGRISPNEGVVEEISTTGSGNIVRENSPVLITPTLGVATATSINGLTSTATTSGFTIAGGAKTLTVSDDTTVSGTNTGDQTTITGNAGTATKLAASKTINGVAFDGSADITVAAAAGTLTETTLASNVVNSSLTSVGTLANLTVTNPISGSVNGNSATVTTNANLTGDVTSIGNATTVKKVNGVDLSGLATGILKNTTSTGAPSIAVAADFPTLNQSTTGNAGTATKLAASKTINGVAFDGSANITVGVAAGSLTGVVPVLSGGTGSATQNFVDLTTSQSIAGTKSFSGVITSVLPNGSPPFVVTSRSPSILNITGYASQLALSNNDAPTTSYSPVLVSSAGTGITPITSTQLKYVPSTGALSAGSFVGSGTSLTGVVKTSEKDAVNGYQGLNALSRTDYVNIPAWVSTKAYIARDIVRYTDGNTYYASGSIAVNTPFTLGTVANTWQLISSPLITWNIAYEYKQYDLVIKSGIVYIANAAIPKNTVWAIGNTGTTWKTLSPPAATDAGAGNLGGVSGIINLADPVDSRYNYLFITCRPALGTFGKSTILIDATSSATYQVSFTPTDANDSTTLKRTFEFTISYNATNKTLQLVQAGYQTVTGTGTAVTYSFSDKTLDSNYFLTLVKWLAL